MKLFKVGFVISQYVWKAKLSNSCEFQQNLPHGSGADAMSQHGLHTSVPLSPALLFSK
jgi:hypothetical protein